MEISVKLLKGKQSKLCRRLEEHWHENEEAKRLIEQALRTNCDKFVALFGEVPLGAVSFWLERSDMIRGKTGKKLFDSGAVTVMLVRDLGSLTAGVGSRLLRKVELEAALNAAPVVIPTTESSVGFYKKLGYQIADGIAFKTLLTF